MPPERDRWYLPDIPDDSYATWERSKFQDHVREEAEKQQFAEDTDDLLNSVPSPSLWAQETTPIPAYVPPPQYTPAPVESQRFYEENSSQRSVGASPFPAEEMTPAPDPWQSSAPAPPPLSPGEQFMQDTSQKIGGFFNNFGGQSQPHDPFSLDKLPVYPGSDEGAPNPYRVPDPATIPRVSDEYPEGNPWKPRETGDERYQRQMREGKTREAIFDRAGSLLVDAPPIGMVRDQIKADQQKVEDDNPNIFGDRDSRARGMVYKDPSVLALLERVSPEQRQEAIFTLRQMGAIPKDVVVPNDFDQDPGYRSLSVLMPSLSDDKMLEQAQKAASRWDLQRENNPARGITYSTAPPKDSASFASSPIDVVEKEAAGAFKNERTLPPEHFDSGFTSFRDDPKKAFTERSEYMERNQPAEERFQENLLLTGMGVGSAGVIRGAAKGTTGLTRVAAKTGIYASDPTDVIFDVPGAVRALKTDPNSAKPQTASAALGGTAGAGTGDEELDPQNAGLGMVAGIVAPRIARGLRVTPKEWNPKLVQIINGTPGDPGGFSGIEGLTVTDEGLEVNLSRYQKPEQAGEVSTRSGVFYTPGQRHDGYGNPFSTDSGPGGSQKIEGDTLFVNPYIHKGYNIETYPEEAGHPEVMEDANRIAALRFVGNPGERKTPIPDRAYRPMVEWFFAKHDIPQDEKLIDNLVLHQKSIIETSTSLSEVWTAHQLRQQGYDGVIALAERETFHGNRAEYKVHEIMDLRERTYPLADGTSEIFEQFSRPLTREEFAAQPGIQFHGTFTDIGQGKKFGGIHVGSQKAARDRLQGTPSNWPGGIPTEGNIIPVKVNLKKPYGSVEKPIDENELFLLTNLPKQMEALKAQGYDGIIYKNIVEDEGSVSYLAFDRSGVQTYDDYLAARQQSSLSEQFSRQPVAARGLVGGAGGAVADDQEDDQSLDKTALGLVAGMATGGRAGKGAKKALSYIKDLKPGAGRYAETVRGPLTVMQDGKEVAKHEPLHTWSLGEGTDPSDLKMAKASAKAHLDYYRSQDLAIDDAEALYDDFLEIKRSDFSGEGAADEFYDARANAWGDFVDDLTAIEDDVVEQLARKPDPDKRFTVLLTGKGGRSQDSFTVDSVAEGRRVIEADLREGTGGWVDEAGNPDPIDQVYIMPTIKDDDGFHISDPDGDPLWAWSRDRDPIPPAPKDPPTPKNTKAEREQFAREAREDAMREDLRRAADDPDTDPTDWDNAPATKADDDLDDAAHLDAVAAYRAREAAKAAPPVSVVDEVTPAAAKTTDDYTPNPPDEGVTRSKKDQERIESAWKQVNAIKGEREVVHLASEVRAFEEAIDTQNRSLIESAWDDVGAALKSAPKLGTPEAAALRTQADEQAAMMQELQAAQTTRVAEATTPATPATEGDEVFPIASVFNKRPSSSSDIQRWSHPSGLEVSKLTKENGESWTFTFMQENKTAGEGQPRWVAAGTEKLDHAPTQTEMRRFMERQVALNDPDEAKRIAVYQQTAADEARAQQAAKATDPTAVTSGGQKARRRPAMVGQTNTNKAGGETPPPPKKPPTDGRPDPEDAPEDWTPERIARSRKDIPYNRVQPLGQIPVIDKTGDGAARAFEALQKLADERPMDISDAFITARVYEIIEQAPEAVRQLAEHVTKMMGAGSELAMSMGTLKVMALLESARNAGTLSEAEKIRAALWAADLPSDLFGTAAVNLGSQIGRAMRQLRKGAIGEEALELSYRWDNFADTLDTEVVLLKDIARKVRSGEALTLDELGATRRVVESLESQHLKDGLYSPENRMLDDLIEGEARSDEDGILAREIMTGRGQGAGKSGNKEIPSFGNRLQYLDEEIARARAVGAHGVANELQKMYEEVMDMARQRAVEQLTNNRKKADLWNTLSPEAKATQIEKRVHTMLGTEHTKIAKADVKAEFSDDPVVVAARQDVRARVQEAIENDRVNKMVSRAEGVMALVRKEPNNPANREAFDTLIGEIESFSNRGKAAAEKLTKKLDAILSKDAEKLRLFNERKAVREAVATQVDEINKAIGRIVAANRTIGKVTKSGRPVFPKDVMGRPTTYEGLMDDFEKKLKALEGTPGADRIPKLREALSRRLDQAAASKMKREQEKILRQDAAYWEGVRKRIEAADRKEEVEPLRKAAAEAMERIRKDVGDTVAHQTFDMALTLLRGIDERAAKLADDMEVRLHDSLNRINTYGEGSAAIKIIEEHPGDTGAWKLFNRAVASLDVDHPRLANQLRERVVKAMDRYNLKTFNARDRADVKNLLKDAQEVAKNLSRDRYPEGTGALLEKLIAKLENQSARGRKAGEQLRERMLRTGLTNFIDTNKFSGGLRDKSDSMVTDMMKRLQQINFSNPEEAVRGIREIAQELRDPRFVDWLREAGVVSMLSNPQTTWIFGINNIANTVNTFVRFGLKYPLQAMLDTGWTSASVMAHTATRGWIPKHERVIHMDSIKAGWRAGRQGSTFNKATRQFGSIMRRGYRTDAVLDAARLGELDRIHREFLTEKFGVVGHVLHGISTRPLMAGDAFLGSLVEEMEMVRKLTEMGRKTGKTPDELRARMGTRAYMDLVLESKTVKDYTLVKRRYNSITQRLTSVVKNMDRKDPARQAIEWFAFHVMPFSTVAENTVKQGLYDYGIAGIPGQAWEIGRGRRWGAKKGEKLSDEGKLDLASNIILGSAIVYAGTALIGDDRLAGSGIIDQKARRNWAPGKKPGHVRVSIPGQDNDQWWDIRGMPFAMQLLQMANFSESMTKEERELKEAGKTIISHPAEYGWAFTKSLAVSSMVTLDSHPVLGAAADLSKWMRGDTPKDTALVRDIMRYIPGEAMLRWMASMGDSYERDKEEWQDAIKFSVPGLRSEIPVTRGQVGGVVENEMSPMVGGGPLQDPGGSAARLLMQFPRRSEEKDDELLQLYRVLEVPSPEIPKEWQGLELERDEQYMLHDLRAEFLQTNKDAIFRSVTLAPSREMKKKMLENWTNQATNHGGALMSQPERSPTFWTRYRAQVEKQVGR